MISTSPKFIIFCLSFGISVVPASRLSAWGGDGSDGIGGGFGAGGGDGCGGCYPESVQRDADNLRSSFFNLPVQELLDQQFLGQLCQNHECGQLSEDQASRFLGREREAARERRETVEREQQAFYSQSSLLLAALSTLIGGGARGLRWGDAPVRAQRARYRAPGGTWSDGGCR